MPTLPTITVTDAQANRMLAAFGSVDEYKKWLKRQIIEFVLAKEQNDKMDAFQSQLASEHAKSRVELGYPE